MTGKQILDLKMGRNDADAATVRDYLGALVRVLWREREGFSGKRPFGNSSWHLELYAALIAARAVPGKLDEDGYACSIDYDTADKAIESAIDALLEVP